MKRVVFAWVTVWLEFDTMEELEEYKVANYKKNWRFTEVHNNEDFYILVVERPYGKYNTGW